MAESFNDFFAGVGQKLAEEIPSTDDSPLNFGAIPEIFHFDEFILQDVIDCMKSLRPSTSCGVDGITAHLLKSAGASIYPVIRYGKIAGVGSS